MNEVILIGNFYKEVVDRYLIIYELCEDLLHTQG